MICNSNELYTEYNINENENADGFDVNYDLDDKSNDISEVSSIISSVKGGYCGGGD